jgi:Tfp pilus assembly protein PilZ
VVDEVYEEKRGFVRMQIDTLVTFTIKGKSEKTYHGISQNLSATGLYMTTEDAVNIDDEVEFIMNSSNQKLPPFVAAGKVIRCETDQTDSKLYHVSVSLSETQ